MHTNQGNVSTYSLVDKHEMHTVTFEIVHKTLM